MMRGAFKFKAMMEKVMETRGVKYALSCGVEKNSSKM
jgi:hypothetical protein